MRDTKTHKPSKIGGGVNVDFFFFLLLVFAKKLRRKRSR